MTWWTSVASLTPIVAYDAGRKSGAQLLDGVGSNHLTATSDLINYDWAYTGVLGNSNPLLMASPVSMPANGVAAAFVKYSHVYTLWSYGVGGLATIFNYAADGGFYSSATGSWDSTGASRPGLLGTDVFLTLAVASGTYYLFINGTQLGNGVSASAYLPTLFDRFGHIGNGNAYNLQSGDTFHAGGFWSGSPTIADLQSLEAAARAELVGVTTPSFKGLTVQGKVSLAPPQGMVLGGPKAEHKNSVTGKHNYYFTGLGMVVGTVKNSPSTPVSRKVFLLDEYTKILVRATWSNATTGAYAFTDLPMDRTYTVISYDHTQTYRAVVADRVVPELMT